MRFATLALVCSGALAASLQPSSAKALKLRGGFDKDAIIRGVGYATSAFILLPAGRDVVSYETALLPGEAETRPLMTATDPKARPCLKRGSRASWTGSPKRSMPLAPMPFRHVSMPRSARS